MNLHDATYEKECLDWVRRFFQDWKKSISTSGKQAQDIRLKGERPDTKIVITYKDRGGHVRSHDHALWDRSFDKGSGEREPPEEVGLLTATWFMEM